MPCGGRDTEGASLERTAVAGRHGARPALPAALALALLACAGACSTLRPIETGTQPVELRDGEALLVLHVYTEVPLESIRLGGHRYRTFLLPGSHVVLFAGPPGRRRFERVWSGLYSWDVRDQPEGGEFEVRAGQVNYPGMLLVEQVGPRDAWSDGWLGFRFANRSMMVRSELERRYPGLLERYALRYTGPGRDRFLEELDAARAAACTTCAPEPAR